MTTPTLPHLNYPTEAMMQRAFTHDPAISQWHTPGPNGWRPPVKLADGTTTRPHHPDPVDSN